MPIDSEEMRQTLTCASDTQAHTHTHARSQAIMNNTTANCRWCTITAQSGTPISKHRHSCLLDRFNKRSIVCGGRL